MKVRWNKMTYKLKITNEENTKEQQIKDLQELKNVLEKYKDKKIELELHKVRVLKKEGEQNMKITMYELLGMIKDGKEPKKIKYMGYSFEYDTNHKRYESYFTCRRKRFG